MKQKIELTKDDIQQMAKQTAKRVREALKRFKENPPKPPSEIEQLRFQAANALLKLRQLAKTDLKALEVLASELRNRVEGLNADATAASEHYRKITRKCATWPAVVSVDKEIQKDQVEFALFMELGADGFLNYSRRQWTRETPEIRASLRLIKWLYWNREQLKLPEFKRKTSLRWWNAGRPMFEQIYGKQFEKHPLFAEKYKWSENRKKQADNLGLKFPTWQRKQILSKMEQAFHTLAPKG